MAVNNQVITEKYAIYEGDCLEVIPEIIPNESIHLSIYSPPFSDLYQYTNSPRDMSNCKTYEEFLQNYEFLIKEISRILMPGRHTLVHCIDISRKATGAGFIDFPGDIIRLHEKHGFQYYGRRCVWKDPWRVARRTMSIGLRHSQVVEDASIVNVAGADYLLDFRKKGKNKIPISHEHGFNHYAGIDQPPIELQEKYENCKVQKSNKLSHYIYRKLMSSVWMDIQIDNVLAYKAARGSDEEKHVCPLQLDVIDRCIDIWSNPGEKVLTPFLGVGSELYGAISKGRFGIGIELKPSYFRQAVENLKHAAERYDKPQGDLFKHEIDEQSSEKYQTCTNKEEISIKEYDIKIKHCFLGWDMRWSKGEKIEKCNRCFYYTKELNDDFVMPNGD